MLQGDRDRARGEGRASLHGHRPGLFSAQISELELCRLFQALSFRDQIQNMNDFTFQKRYQAGPTKRHETPDGRCAFPQDGRWRSDS